MLTLGNEMHLKLLKSWRRLTHTHRHTHTHKGTFISYFCQSEGALSWNILSKKNKITKIIQLFYHKSVVWERDFADWWSVGESFLLFGAALVILLNGCSEIQKWLFRIKTQNIIWRFFFFFICGNGYNVEQCTHTMNMFPIRPVSFLNAFLCYF